MAANTQQFGSREDYSREGNTRIINEVSTHSTSLEQQLQETNQQVAALTDLFNANFSSVLKVCGICKQGHYTDKCPSLEHTAKEVNAVGMQRAYQRKHELYWRAEQPSQQYGNQGNYQGRPMNYQRPSFQQSSQAAEMQQMREAMEMMRKQISQLASAMSELKTQGQQRIPSQPKMKESRATPKKNCKCLTKKSRLKMNPEKMAQPPCGKTRRLPPTR
ncbi:hypothetical protein COLO4_12293 [Corchorus olitorius]|uniref:General substrate transporter (ISS) n=1 Tax=Corchorus olitorius TaxID=93759 RepID=A0A1R3K1C2_9ROSI|nr:hypothetical protein COLO4_12293 [Corchorus olitorius]